MPDILHLTEADYRPEAVAAAASRLVVISGCSGGGKSTLLDELARRGHPVFLEPGRQIVKEQLAIGGDALPWAGGGLEFGKLVLSRNLHQMTLGAMLGRTCFFDRGLDDIYTFLREEPSLAAAVEAATRRFRYAPRVFLAPPWPELFAGDRERRHSLEDALAHYERDRRAYAELGYETLELPKAPVAERADFVLAHISLEGG